MRIKEIQVDGFGAWSNLKLESLSDQLTVFYGPNEAGKTTLMQLIRGVLYGYSPERRRRYLPPVEGGAEGGSLLIDSSLGRVRVARDTTADGDPLGAVRVASADGKSRNREVLAQMLSGVDEPTFKNVFAVGLRELQELNTLDATEASQLLYNLTTGLDRVGLMEVMEELQQSRQKILGGDDEELSEMEELLAARRRLGDELQELEQHSRSWYDTVGELATVKQEIESQHRRNEQIEAEIRTVDAALPIRHRWDERRRLQQQLKADDQNLAVTPAALKRLAEVKQQIASLREQAARIKQQRRRLKKDAAGLGINRRIMEGAEKVEQLVNQTNWMDSLEQQIRQLQPAAGVKPPEGKTLHLTAIQPPATPPPINTLADKSPGKQPAVTSRVLSSLRGPARAVREASKRLKAARHERDRSQVHVEEVADRLETELVERGENSLRQALEKAGALVTRLRRRIQIEERLEKMTRHRDELEQDVEQLLDESVLPLSGLMWPGLVFIVGFSMLVSGIIYEELLNLGGLVSLLGIFAVAASVMWKVYLERQAQQELDTCNRQLRSLNDQIRQAQDEQDEVDRHLPQGGGSLDARLAKAEGDLERLESLVPLDADRQIAGQRGSGAERKVEQAEQAVKEARGRWRAALRRHKLPEHLKPSEVRELAELTEEQLEAERKKKARLQELETRERELLGFWSRIEQVARELGVKIADGDPRQQLQQLTGALKEQRRLVAKKAELRGKFKKLGRELKKANARGRGLSKKRRELLAEMGVANEKQLQQLSERKRQAALVAKQIEEESARIEAELDAHEALRETVAELVETLDCEQLAERREEREQKLDDGQATLSRLHHRKGAMEQEIRAAGEDKRQGRLRLEIAGLDRRIDELVRHWRVLNVSSQVLQKIRHDYENERQPETLNVASQYLEQLTEGRYRRIWTPFGEAALRIENDEGTNLPLDVLSAGTREAVFVCLRLALAANFAQRGAALPLVLDDVLVNFDVTRADAAAAVLMGYAARGHQMLLFTCHEHIMEAFQSAGAEIRVLPGRGAELLERRRRQRAETAAPAAEEETPQEQPAADAGPPPAKPQVVLVLPDEQQDEIDVEMEDELLDAAVPQQPQPEPEQPDLMTWCSFWFQEDDLLDFAPPQAPAEAPAEETPPVWETAEMWWDDEPSPPRRAAAQG